MIKLGKLTDYAVVLMVQMVREGEATPRSASQLALQTGLPEPTVAKVLKQLSQSDLVESLRGAAGGYKLSAKGSGISICDVIEAMDGPIAITSCVDSACKTESICPAKGKWTPVNTAIRAALKAVTIADMALPQAADAMPLVQITGGSHAHIK
jgi:FeS assembly SUF system regulator